MFWIPFALLLLITFWMIVIFNRLVRVRNDAVNAWHQIDVQLKRRHDLIPNLVAVVKGYMEYEQQTLERVVAARARAIAASGIREKAKAENVLTEALSALSVVIENYPVLKSNENVLALQEELTSTENRIAFSRQLYNDLVANLMTRIQVFPDCVIAGLFSFRGMEYFSAQEGDRQPPVADISVRR
jgi:LemA protein